MPPFVDYGLTFRRWRNTLLVTVGALVFLSAIGGSAASNATEPANTEHTHYRNGGARQVVVTVLSWYSPIGMLNGSKWWSQFGYGYEGSKKSNGVENYPLTPELSLLPLPPEVGSRAFHQLQYQAALVDLHQMQLADFDVAAFDMLPMPAFEATKLLSPSNVPFTHFETFIQWLRAGEKVGMKVALFADVRNQSADYPKGYTLNVKEWVNTIGGALDNLSNFPALWRLDGRPVVIHFGTDYSSGSPPEVSAERPDGGWRYILKALRDSGRAFYFIADVRPHLFGGSQEWSRIADAVHMFAPASPASFLAEVQTDMSKSYTVPFMWSVSPGYYNTAFNAYTEPDFRRIHGTYLAAMKAGAKVMNVLTWNDFAEDTDIAPSVNKRRHLLDIFSFYNRWFKSGAQPPVTDDKVIVAYPIRIPSEIHSRPPVYGGGKWAAPPYTPKIFYWANIRAGRSLEVMGVGKVELPSGLSMGELGVASGGPVFATLGAQSMRLPAIKNTSAESQRKGSGGLEYRYVMLTQ